MHCCTARKILVVLLALMFLAVARQSSAELIFFAADRSMSVQAHRFEGDQVVVSLRGGGEMSFDRAMILRIAPDEVPYDVPAALTDASLSSPHLAPLMDSTTYDPIIEHASAAHDVDA